MNNIFDFLFNSIWILGYSLIFIFAGGLIIDVIEKKSNYYLQRSFGYSGILLTGFGTVIHELSHLIFVLLGGMKPTEVKLFRPIKGRRDGVLGYVSYSVPGSNSIGIKKFYNKIFLIPIGIAPIIGGTLVILFSLKLCLPVTFDFLVEEIKLFANNFNGFSFDLLSSQCALIVTVLKSIFAVNNIKKWSFWIFIFIVLSIASHMSLSMADIKGCMKGVPYLLLVIMIVNASCLLMGLNYNDFIEKVTIYNGYVIAFLGVSVLFSILNLIITFIINKLISFIK